MPRRVLPPAPPKGLQEGVARQSGEIGRVEMSNEPPTLWGDMRWAIRHHSAAEKLRADGRRGPKPKWQRMRDAIDYLQAQGFTEVSDGSASRCVQALHRFLFDRDLRAGERADRAEFLAGQLVALKNSLIKEP